MITDIIGEAMLLESTDWPAAFVLMAILASLTIMFSALVGRCPNTRFELEELQSKQLENRQEIARLFRDLDEYRKELKKINDRV
jgi:hypothetical protein